MKDLLKYYIALQPKFREASGDLLQTVNDEYLCPKGVFVTTSRLNCSSKCRSHNEDCYKNPFIFIPRTIDDSSEEARKRSLLGMLQGFISLDYKGKKRGYYVWTMVKGKDEVMVNFECTTPTEAILKALCAQWNVEVTNEPST